MTIAATHRHGCRSGTALMAAGLSGGDETSTLIGVSGDQLVAPLITGLSIMPASTPQLVAIVL